MIEKLSEKYRPQRIRDIVGQDLTILQEFVASPYPSCWAFVGKRGCGKTTAAFALMFELGATSGFPGVDYVRAADLGLTKAVDPAQVVRFTNCNMCCPKRDHIHGVILEDASKLSTECQDILKVGLECQLGERAVVVATSNDLSGLDPALVDRFTVIEFQSGPAFAAECNERIKDIAAKEGIVSLPVDYQRWGTDGNCAFSMRRALDRLQTYILRSRHVATPPKDEDLKF